MAAADVVEHATKPEPRTGAVAEKPEGMWSWLRLSRQHPGGRAFRVFVGISAFMTAAYMKVPMCPTASTLNMPCPGCGLTRATLALGRFDFHAAYHFHPLSFFISPVVVFGGLYLMYSYIRTGSVPVLKNRPLRYWSVIIFYTVLVGVWIARFFGHFGGPVAV